MTMKFSTLLAGRFDEYFEQAKAAQPLWAFVHVPKTAGSSLNVEMQRILQPAYNIHIDHLDSNRTYFEKFDDAVEKFISQAQQKKYRYVAGHIRDANVQRLRAALPDVRPVTLLRLPVTRYISDYRYQRTPAHPPHETFKAKYPDILSYMSLTTEFNKAATYLLPRDMRLHGNPRVCTDYVMENYAFVGLRELFPLSIRVLTALAGSSRQATAFERVTEETGENAVDLTAELTRNIRFKNSLDSFIHGEITAKVREIKDGLMAYLKKHYPIS